MGGVVDKYDVTSRSYDELYRREQYSKYKYMFMERGITVKETILDMGCGTGLLIDYLKENKLDGFSRYICVDPSIGMLEKAVGKHSSDWRIVFINAYCEDTLLVEHIIDQIYMFTVWDNLDDKEKCLKNLYLALKDNGEITISILAKRRIPRDEQEILNRYGLRLIGERIDYFYHGGKRDKITLNNIRVR